MQYRENLPRLPLWKRIASKLNKILKLWISISVIIDFNRSKKINEKQLSDRYAEYPNFIISQHMHVS
jgi:hypothetical protein